MPLNFSFHTCTLCSHHVKEGPGPGAHILPSSLKVGGRVEVLAHKGCGYVTHIGATHGWIPISQRDRERDRPQICL